MSHDYMKYSRNAIYISANIIYMYMKAYLSFQTPKYNSKSATGNNTFFQVRILLETTISLANKSMDDTNAIAKLVSSTSRHSYCGQLGSSV